MFLFFFSSNSKLIAQKGAFADFIIEHLREMDEDEEGRKMNLFFYSIVNSMSN